MSIPLINPRIRRYFISVEIKIDVVDNSVEQFSVLSQDLGSLVDTNYASRISILIRMNQLNILILN